VKLAEQITPAGSDLDEREVDEWALDSVYRFLANPSFQSKSKEMVDIAEHA
jgi:hypothetical protein